MQRVNFAAAGLVGLFLWACSPANAAQPYVGTLLGSGNVTGSVSDINNSGQVAGRLEYPGGGGDERALVFSGAGVTFLSLPSFGHNGAEGISDNGYVTGYLKRSDDEYRAFLWKDGATEVIGTLGGNYSHGSAVNIHGQVVGYSRIDGAGERAFLFDNGVMTNLGTLGGSRSFAADINSVGQIVGSSTNALDIRRAFIYEAGVMHDLGTLGGDSSQATAINEVGQVVGSSQTSNGETHAFLWSAGVMVDLGTLGRRLSGASDVNDNGQVIGTVGGGGGTYAGFVYSAGSMVELEPLILFDSPTGFRTSFGPGAINNLGQIVGAVQLDSAADYFFPMLLTPIPEPSAWQLLLFGFVATALSKRGQRAPATRATPA